MTMRRSPYEYPGTQREEDVEDHLSPSASAAAASAVGSLFGRAMGQAGDASAATPPSAHYTSSSLDGPVGTDLRHLYPPGYPDAHSVELTSSDPPAASPYAQNASFSRSLLTPFTSLPRSVVGLVGSRSKEHNLDGHGMEEYKSGDDWDKDARRKSWLRVLLSIILLFAALAYRRTSAITIADDMDRPDYIYEHPYVTSSYYTATKSMKTLRDTERIQVIPRQMEERRRMASGESQVEKTTRLAIVRPFCEFDAGPLPSTFACWNSLVPCKAGSGDLGDIENVALGVNSTDETERLFDNVGSDIFKDAVADLFLFYSQTFSDNDDAIHSVDQIIDEYNSPGGWSNCFDNIYAIEANIPQELDLYIPSAQEELYNWVNGPNRQFEAAFRIIQSGEWGDYDGFYLMEGDSIPVKSHWLDVVLSEIEVKRPFAILGAQYDGDKWDQFYEQIPISLLHHTNGNAIYNTSHPLMERLVGQLEVEAPCPYNSIPYDYRMSQMWVEGTLGIVPELAPKIMLNEEGENITLSDNLQIFSKWGDLYKDEDPFKYTKVIHNYAATNLIPRHLGPEYIIHGAKLYSPWDPVKTGVTLVVSEWFFDRSEHLLTTLDRKDHPFSEVVVMLPPDVEARDDYDEMSVVPIRAQYREKPDFMDICAAEIDTEWFMITNSYHHVANHVDLMFVPGSKKPVVPFTPATYPFCLKFPYCKETVNLAKRYEPGHKQVVQDMDMLFHTETRNAFCKEWMDRNGEEGEDLYQFHKRRLAVRKKIVGPSGPTGTDYAAYLKREGKDGMYKFTDRSLYGARANFIKVFSKEEKLDGLSEEDSGMRSRLLGSNSTDCDCAEFEIQSECEESPLGCQWRPLFDSCHPPEMIDDGTPICPSTEAPTMAPTVSLEGLDTMVPTISPTKAPTEALEETDPWFADHFKARESETAAPTVAPTTAVPTKGPTAGGGTRRLSVVNGIPAVAPAKPPSYDA